MSAQRGRDLLLKIERGGSFETVGGLRAKTLSFDARTVDVTDSESAGRWRELLAGSGVRRASVSGSGLFKNGDTASAVREAFFSGGSLRWRVIVPGFGAIEGPMQMSRLEYAGSFDGEVTFEIALESAGEVTFAPEDGA